MDFSDIRAYPERLFGSYWQKIINDPHFKAVFEHIGKGQESIKERFLHLSNLEQFRAAMIMLIDAVVQKTTKGITFSGTEELQSNRNKGSLFISNHRSTSLDPVFFNYMLHRETGETAFNAAGDNLLNTTWLGHLIRLNKGFIVKRKVEDLDEKLMEANRLSSYIRSLLEKGRNVWIAQRGGRAKDGNDETDSAVIAMLKLSHKEKSWSDFCQDVPIIPVSMSYEEIPLDMTLTKDHLGLIDLGDKKRDSRQILNEMGERKRRIHIHLSPRIFGEKRSEIVDKLDRNIIRGTKIWQSNRYAASLLQALDSERSKPVKWLRDKLRNQEETVRYALLKLYAAPLVNQLRFHQERL